MDDCLHYQQIKRCQCENLFDNEPFKCCKSENVFDHRHLTINCCTSENHFDDQPIDYSQFSSRWKESLEGNKRVHHGDETHRKLSSSTTEHISRDTVSNSKKISTNADLEFIRSPTIHRNVTSQKCEELTVRSPHGECDNTSTDYYIQITLFKPVSPQIRLPETTSCTSSLFTVPATSSNLHTTYPTETNPTYTSATKCEGPVCNQHSGCAKSAGIYHPKLKYILASLKSVKRDEKPGTGIISGTENSRHSSHYALKRDNFTSDDMNGKTVRDSIYKSCNGGVRFESLSSNKITKMADNSRVLFHDNVHSERNYGPSLDFENNGVQEAKCTATNKFIITTNDLDFTLHGGRRELHHLCKHEPPQNKSSVRQNRKSPFALQDISGCVETDLLASIGSAARIKLPTNDLGVTLCGEGRKSHNLLNPVSPKSVKPSHEYASSVAEMPCSVENRMSVKTKSRINIDACADSSKRFASGNVAHHSQIDTKESENISQKCPHCEKTYVSRAAYVMHVRTHRQGCQCPYCGKHFSRAWLLQGHVRTHTGERPFPCLECGKRFADKSNLRAHVQTHAAEKVHVCCRCRKAFALKSYLHKHQSSACLRSQRLKVKQVA